ncbi:MAG: AAA family ATPase [Bacteroidia bacterium]|jgi:DNA replication protein DnaC|nr:AAA family ATPase [Bacteroidia bacterium]
MYQDLIRELCRQLRLGSHIADVYPEIEAGTQEEYLLKVLTEAKENRETERRKRYIQQAGFDLMKALDDFDFGGITLPADLSPDLLRSCDFVTHKQNLILYGRPGTGKTHLAIALGVEACKHDYRVLYYKTSRLVNLLSQAKAEHKDLSFWRKLGKADVLILDEWGYIPFERVGTQLLFEAISDCYEKRSVIITTNLPFDEWNTIFYDQKLTAAILDRLVHHGRLLMHDGQSYRLQHSTMQ